MLHHGNSAAPAAPDSKSIHVASFTLRNPTPLLCIGGGGGGGKKGGQTVTQTDRHRNMRRAQRKTKCVLCGISYLCDCMRSWI